ncbi:NUDIX domain-containing protein [Sphingorhabdus sp.]|uniref:NUDIX hydrolase n=1 Tax=Sphingorhabdus sp. TaxID=1902408 RepID=UPI0035932764
MNAETNAEPIATPAATMVIFRQNPSGGAPLILMVERIKAMAFAGGAAVFPGGKVDAADFDFAEMLGGPLPLDEAAARLAAIRETIEEAGLALGLVGVSDPADCDAARAALHDGESLQAICVRHGWAPDFDQLVPWSRWRPPAFERASRVFDTRFYLVDAGNTTPLATVDHTENRALFWASAAEVLEKADRGEIMVIFPTRRNLERLAIFGSFDAAAAHAAEHPVSTVLTYIDKREDGNWLCIPDGHGYPVLQEPIASALRG